MDPSTIAYYISLMPEEVPYNATIEQRLDNFEVINRKTFKVYVNPGYKLHVKVIC
jgi:hypothetical protein